ncbi:hypothetical protein [Butyrivibrio sp. JL13D10]|uniref:hypothetical protein n=1 Tax=Butyrivibrio sp. JL13D10 TaxID=3236815 RepID=UPI0038B6894E
MKEKYALLDTDFISKTHLIRKDEENKLIDRITEMPGYRFYCHEQIKTELQRHNIAGSPEWLEKKISSGVVHCITDEEIVDELKVIYSDSAVAMYSNMLKNGCEAYRSGYFEEQFKRLQGVDYLKTTKEQFLKELSEDCDDIGPGNNLGELKSYVLLQTLSIKFGEQIYVFCSDDRNARNGIVSLGGARCISVLSSFMRLNVDANMTREEAQPYLDSYLEESRKNKQTTFRVHDTSKEMRYCRVPCEQVIDEMYAGKFDVLLNGNLRYKE